jgi:hypothetical protein
MKKYSPLFLIVFLISYSTIGNSYGGNVNPFTKSYNIRDFGAVGDGVTFDTDAINKAIEAC